MKIDRWMFVLGMAMIGSANASTPKEDYLVDMAREEFRLARAPTVLDLVPGKTWECVSYLALDGALSSYGERRKYFRFELEREGEIVNGGALAFRTFRFDPTGARATAVAFSYKMRGTENAVVRVPNSPGPRSILVEHSVDDARYFSGVGAIATPSQIVFAYDFCR